jgi:hypothetical protein
VASSVSCFDDHSRNRNTCLQICLKGDLKMDALVAVFVGLVIVVVVKFLFPKYGSK